MRRLILLSLIGLLTMSEHAASQAIEEKTKGPPAGFVYHSIEVDGRDYPYAIYRPRGLDPATPARGLVFLHGMGECGTDGSRQIAVGLGPALMWSPERWPFVVLMPQKPVAMSEWEDHEEAVMAMLDRMILEHNVDPGRVAITGLSQGGHGAIALVERHHERFRAAAPVCGYAGRRFRDGERVGESFPAGEAGERLIEAFRTTPVWFFHGEEDAVVPPSESERLHELLADAGCESKLTIFPQDGHNSWDSAYGESGVWEWLAEHTD
jgi:predicted peptidase